MNRLKSTVAVAVMALSTTLLAQTHQIPVPTTVSKPMAAAVAAPVADLWLKAPKSVSDWQAIASEYADTVGRSALSDAKALNVDVQATKIASVNVYVLTPKTIDQDKADKIIFYIHGGGYILGHGASGIVEALPMAADHHYKVVCVDYRMAPEFPFPAAIDDAFAVYQELVKTHGADNIAVMGTSTGGAMTLILALQAHDAKVPMPAALISGTPWSDMDKIGDSYFVNDGVDNVLGSYDGLIKTAVEYYAKGHDLKDPLLSPVYASDDALQAFPPTLLISGTRDLFLSNTVRMHTRLLLNKAPAELIVHEALSHAQYYFVTDAPETENHYRLLDDFLDRVWVRKPQK
jgi:monoterpene epsilon-lactone hydrolase